MLDSVLTRRGDIAEVVGHRRVVGKRFDTHRARRRLGLDVSGWALLSRLSVFISISFHRALRAVTSVARSLPTHVKSD